MPDENEFLYKAVALFDILDRFENIALGFDGTNNHLDVRVFAPFFGRERIRNHRELSSAKSIPCCVND
jgi:hypothetical protein